MNETYWKLSGLCGLFGLFGWTFSGYNELVLMIGLVASIGLPFLLAVIVQLADQKTSQDRPKLTETQIKLLANSAYKLEDRPPLKVEIRTRIKY